MGQCCSAPACDRPRQAPEPGPTGLADRVLYPAALAPSGGVQLVVSQARYSAAPGGDDTPLLCRHTPQGVLVALFEGLGKQGHAVAAFCRSRIFELFQECSVCHPDSPLEALKQTLERLDATIFATDRLKHATKVSSGASAVLLLVEMGNQRCYCANVGAAQCLLSRIAGSFNAKTPEGFFLTNEHTTRNREETVRLQRRAPGEAKPPRATAASGGQGQGETAAQPTRALGFMEAKRQGGGSGALVCEASVTDHALTGTDQHLVVGTAAFWELVGPVDCALRAHFHEKFARRELDRAAAVSAAAAAAGLQDGAPSPALLQAANTAEHLIYWSLEKAARKLGRVQQQRALRGQQQKHAGSAGPGSERSTQWGRRAVLPPSVADVMSLPLERPPAPLPQAAAGVAAGVGGIGAAEAARTAAAMQHDGNAQRQEEEPLQQLIRSDVHGELGVIVVTLRRQDQSMDGGMRNILMAARASAAVQQQAAAQGGGGAGGASGGGYVERLALRRWNQVRMLVDFHKAHRRALLRQWWGAQDALFRRSRVAGAGGGRIGMLGSLSPNKLAAAKGGAEAGGGRHGAGKAAAGAAPAAAAGASSAGASNIKAVRPLSARK